VKGFRIGFLTVEDDTANDVMPDVFRHQLFIAKQQAPE
jgi:hypothetical protein